MKHRTPHWTTLPIVRIVSFVQNNDGTESISDIVETGGKYVAVFFRRARRDANVVRIVVSDNARDLRLGRTVYKGRNGALEYDMKG